MAEEIDVQDMGAQDYKPGRWWTLKKDEDLKRLCREHSLPLLVVKLS